MRKGRDGEKKRGGKVIASSRPPELRPLECRMLVPIISKIFDHFSLVSQLKQGQSLIFQTEFSQTFQRTGPTVIQYYSGLSIQWNQSKWEVSEILE